MELSQSEKAKTEIPKIPKFPTERRRRRRRRRKERERRRNGEPPSFFSPSNHPLTHKETQTPNETEEEKEEEEEEEVGCRVLYKLPAGIILSHFQIELEINRKIPNHFLFVCVCVCVCLSLSLSWLLRILERFWRDSRGDARHRGEKWQLGSVASILSTLIASGRLKPGREIPRNATVMQMRLSRMNTEPDDAME